MAEQRVKTPGQVLHEAWEAAAPGWWRNLGAPCDWGRKCDEAAAQAVLAADPVRREALELVDELASLLKWHETDGEGDAIAKDERQVIARARALLAKAKGGCS